MYSVIGSDGQTYGPADFDTLKAWCQEGRIHADTRIIDPMLTTHLSRSPTPELLPLKGSVCRRG